MKILQIAACPFPANHGTPGAIREIVNTLAAWGHEVHVVTYPVGERVAQDRGEGRGDSFLLDKSVRLHRVLKFRQADIKVGPFKERFFYDFIMPWHVLRVAREYAVDIIHAHNYESLLAVLPVKPFVSVPVIYNAITLMGDELPTYNILPEKIARRLGVFIDCHVPPFADFVIANTEKLKNFFLARGMASEKLEVVPTAIDLSFFSGGNGRRIREKLHLSGKKIVLYTGTFDYFQGLDLLIKAFVPVAREIEDAVLLLAGSTVGDEEKDALLGFVRQAGLENRVYFEQVGLEELPDFLAAADLTVCPRPDSGGMPVKILNYLAAKKPVLAFEGAAGFLLHGKEAWLVPGSDVDAFSSAMLELLRNGVLAANLAEQGFLAVKNRYDLPVVCRQILSIYETLVRR